MSDEKRVEPTEEFLQHHSIERVDTAKAGNKRTRVMDQRWIDYYLKHGHITPLQHQAAEQLLSLHRAAGRSQKVTGSLDGIPTPTAHDMSEYSANSMKDYFKLKWVMGTFAFNCVQDIVIYDFSAPEWAKKNSRNPKAATEIFRMCLDDLNDAFKRLRDKPSPHHPHHQGAR